MRECINVKRLISLVIILCVTAFMYSVLFQIFSPAYKVHKAAEGRLDLSDWDLKKAGIVNLNGEWEFYPGSLLSPGETAHAPGRFMEVPGSWGKKQLFSKPARGCGTYRLSVKLPDKSGNLFLKVQNIRMAHRIYINGNLMKESGNPAPHKGGFEALNTSYMLEVGSGDTLDIVIQVSSYHYYDGGIIRPLLLGDENSMKQKVMLDFGSDLAGLFLFFTFGIFHLHLYRMRDREISYLYSGIYLVLLAFTIITTGEKIFMRFLEGLPFDTAYKFQDFVSTAGFPFLILFIRSVEPRVANRKLLLAGISPVLLYIILILSSPLPFHSAFKDEITIYQNSCMVLLVIRLFYIMIKNKDRTLPLNEFACIVSGFVFITLIQLDTGFNYLDITYINVIGKVSSLGFLLSLNILLARRFTNKLKEVQALSEELKQSNEVKNEYISRMSLLQVQLKPHFLYNTLNNIIALCYEDAEKAADLVYLLSTYLRNVFQTDQADPWIPVVKELELIDAYIKIEKLRFGDRLKFKTNIDSVIYAEQIIIPALLIQPLVENAIQHGIFNKQGGGTVRLSVMEGDYFLKIMVEDDGTGMSDDQVYQLLNEDTGPGAGIKIIRKRIEAIPKASFTIDSEMEKGTRCILYLPKEKTT